MGVRFHRFGLGSIGSLGSVRSNFPWGGRSGFICSVGVPYAFLRGGLGRVRNF